MRQGQSKRMRGRGRGGSNGSNGGGNTGGGKGPNPLTRSYESNGPDVKIRGTAGTIADKYVQLSRDAQTSGDPVAAENYMQHAEHYYRLLAAAQAQYQPNQTVVRADADDFNDVEFDGEGEGNEPNGYQAGQGAGQLQGGYQNNQNGQNNGFQQNRSQNSRPNGGYNNGPRDGEQPRQERSDRRDRPEFPRDRNEGGYRQDARNDARQDVRNDSAPADGELERDRSQDRAQVQERPPERTPDRVPERGRGRAERAARPDPSGDQPPVGGLPAFITGGGAPQRTAEPAPEPAEPLVEVVASPAEAIGAEDGDQPGAARGGRRRRYGRARGLTAEGGEDAPSPQPEPSE